MAPKLSKDSLQAVLDHHRAQATQGGALATSSKPAGNSSKPAGNSSETASDTSPLILKHGKKRTPADVVKLETTSMRHATPPTTIDAPSRLKRVRFDAFEPSYLFSDFLLDASSFSLWSPGFLAQQKGDELLKSFIDIDMFEATGAMGMYQWIQAANLRSYAIAHHLELKEHSRVKTISELKQELVKLRESHTGEICSLEGRVKKAERKRLGGPVNKALR